MWWILTGFTTTLIVLIDFFLTFDASSIVRTKASTWYWLIGFIVVNLLFAMVLHCYLFHHQNLSGLEPWFRSIVLGLGYSALVHTRLTTLKIGAQEIPIGLELVYENAKRVVYTHINREVIRSGYSLAEQKARQKNLKRLAIEAEFMIQANKMLTDEQREEYKRWLLGVLQDPVSVDFQKKLVLAHFINCGERLSNGDNAVSLERR